MSGEAKRGCKPPGGGSTNKHERPAINTRRRADATGEWPTSKAKEWPQTPFLEPSLKTGDHFARPVSLDSIEPVKFQTRLGEHGRASQYIEDAVLVIGGGV